MRENETPKIINDNGLLTFKNESGETQTLGYLFDFTGHGIYDPTLGKVDVQKSEVETHNKTLDEMLLNGLDQNCEIGQGYTFYWSEKPLLVKTFIGTLVSDRVEKNGRSITFYREGKTYRGREQKDVECFNFRRVS